MFVDFTMIPLGEGWPTFVDFSITPLGQGLLMFVDPFNSPLEEGWSLGKLQPIFLRVICQ